MERFILLWLALLFIWEILCYIVRRFEIRSWEKKYKKLCLKECDGSVYRGQNACYVHYGCPIVELKVLKSKKNKKKFLCLTTIIGSVLYLAVSFIIMVESCHDGRVSHAEVDEVHQFLVASCNQHNAR
jgi:hypothetical protein